MGGAFGAVDDVILDSRGYDAKKLSIFRGISANSAIPQPSSTMKRSSSNIGGNYPGSHVRSMSTFTPGTTTKRASTDGNRRSGVYRPRQSAAPAASNHQSFFQTIPVPAGVLRDPRPLKDRSFQAQIGQEIMEYMVQHNFEMEMKHVLSQNVLKSPTQKDFNYMFQWLYHRIDPSHKFRKNIDQEVPPLLKQMRYPFERSITKSQIAAVGGQNWSIFLGLLHWMMQLAQMLDGYVNCQYDEACMEAGIDVSGDRIIFDFLSNGYRDWLAMDEDLGDEEAERVLAPHVQSMAAAFERSISKYTSELDILEAENARLLKEIEDLEKSTPDPAVLDHYFKIMEEDKVKFEEYNALVMQRSDKYENRSQVLQEELDKLLEELQEADEERRSLQKAVDAQGISMEDIDRMTAERGRLQRGIESASQRLEEVKKKVFEREAEASRKLGKLEQMVDRYNAMAYQIALIPSTAVNAKGREFELQVTVADDSNFTSSIMKGSPRPSSADRLVVDPTTGHQAGHILNLDLRGKIRNSFISLRKEISDRRATAMDEMIEDHDLLDGIKEAIEDRRGEVETLNHRVRAAEDEYEKTKEVTAAQKLASDAHIEKMEKELSRMRAGLSENVQILEQREINTTIEYEQLVLQANTLREELHTEIDRMLNDVIKVKIHVQKSLDDYEGFVTEELEKELGSDEMQAEAPTSSQLSISTDY
ncbi:hypothetical protein FPOA_12726 [Fusarium poae]|uniref:Kinetochore protein NDC80 n=1 Tax=Fusarium poae TaxID=36050 RepID=A0A1B8A8B0_FUSPO|nr:hypothetical protein FPOA_12726 [Fusarium poae]